MVRISNQSYKAITISLAVHTAVLAFLNWYSSGGEFFESDQDVWGEQIEVQLIELPEPELITEIDPVTGEVRNVVANRDAASSQEVRNFRRPSEAQMSEEVYNELMDLEQQVLDELAAERESNESGKEDPITQQEEDKQDLKDYDWFNEESYAGNVTISYSLQGRYDLDLRNPGYTCKVSGQVTINIEVSQTGEVLSADINPQLTTTSDPCLIDQSIKYALLSSFNHDPAAVKRQEGTITYLFLAQ